MKASVVSFSKKGRAFNAPVSYVYANIERKTYHKTKKPSFIFPIYSDKGPISGEDFLNKFKEDEKKIKHELKIITPYKKEGSTDDCKEVNWRLHENNSVYTDYDFGFPYISAIATPLMFSLYFCKDNNINTIIIEGLNYQALSEENKSILLRFLHYGDKNKISFIGVKSKSTRIPLILNLNKVDVETVISKCI